MTYVLIIPHIACSISTVIVHKVWFILFLTQNYLGKLQYRTDTKETQKLPEAKGTNCVKFKKFFCNITAVGMGIRWTEPRSVGGEGCNHFRPFWKYWTSVVDLIIWSRWIPPHFQTPAKPLCYLSDQKGPKNWWGLFHLLHNTLAITIVLNTALSKTNYCVKPNRCFVLSRVLKSFFSKISFLKLKNSKFCLFLRSLNTFVHTK